MHTFTIEPRGPFRLEEAARFGFGQRHDTDFDGVMRLAFCVDGYQRQAGVSLTQVSDGSVHGVIEGIAGPSHPGATDAVEAQVARVLSLDHDATGYQALGDADSVIGRLLAAAPGLRPPLFYSPYEAALWSVISLRRPAATANRWRTRLSQVAGRGFDVAGTEMWAAPTPQAVVDLGPDEVARAAGIEPARAERIVGVAEAALAGKLDAATLAALAEDQARAVLRSIDGIGPFYSDLILIRATGVADVLPLHEPRLLRLLGQLYDRPGPFTPKEAERQAEGWRPWRTWVAVLVRAAGPRVLGTMGGH